MTSAACRSCAAVLLDMDGTLVDSHAAVETVWASWARENGIDRDAVVSSCHGRQIADTIRRFRPDLDDSAVAAAVDRQLDRECAQLDGVRPARGALELLAWLDATSIPWAVVTNAPARLAAARLGAARIEPPELLTLDDVERGKPAPDGYLIAAHRLGVAPWNAWAVEDSAAGLAAARAAGAVVVAVGGATDADVVCAALPELHRLLVVGRMREAGSGPIR